MFGIKDTKRVLDEQKVEVPTWTQKWIDALPIRGIIPPPRKNENHIHKVPKLPPRRPMIPPDEEGVLQCRQKGQRMPRHSKKMAKSHRSRRRKHFRYQGPTLASICEEDEADEGTDEGDANEEETGNEAGTSGLLLQTLVAPTDKAAATKLEEMRPMPRPIPEANDESYSMVPVQRQVSEGNQKIGEEVTRSATSAPNLPWWYEKPPPLPENIEDYIEVTEYAPPEEPFIYITLEEGEIISDFAMRKIWKRILRTVPLQFTD